MSERFDFIQTPLTGLYLIECKPIRDNRGFFSRFFCADEFKAIGFTDSIQQMNHTLSRQKGTVRGMHFQYPPHTEMKVVNCIKGEIWDVAVDIRKGSPTFLQWYGVHLSADKMNSLCIPEGFAHGFQTLTHDCELLYIHSSSYAPGSEGAINTLDSKLSIAWPIEITEMSQRDREHAMLDENFEGIVVE